MVCETVFQGDRLQAVGTDLHRPRIFVTFDHRRKDREAFPAYAPVQHALDRGMGHLWIASHANDWFLNPDLAALRRALRGYSEGREMRAVGFSMGGYGAMLLAADLRLTHMMLFAPQVTIFPDRWPHDPRYAEHAAALDPTLDHLPACAEGGPEGLVVYDPRLQPMDRHHAGMVCAQFPRMRPVALPFGGHPPLQNFPKGMGFARLSHAFMDGALTAGDVRQMHRSARLSSERYARHMARYAAGRMQRPD